MSEEIAIRIQNVSKQYRLGAIGGGTLKGDLQTWMAKMRGKEDPNSKIGATVYAKNEKFMALQDINLEIRKGEAVGIIGHNGAGKSTLLKLLTRVTAPTAGEIYIDGRIASMLEVGTGFHPELSGRDNVYLNGAILGMSKKEVTERFDEIVEFSEVAQFIDTPVKRYSSGMYVKLAFAVAAHLNSEIMIMDEVLAVGDVNFQRKCIDKMSNAAHVEGKTVLYVSHNMETIRRLCTRVIVLEKGRIIYDGEVEKAIELYVGKREDSKPKMDYTNYTRDDKNDGVAVFLESAEFLGKEKCTFEPGEKARIEYKFLARTDIDNLSIRFELKGTDDTPVGTFFSDDIISCKKNERYTLVLEYDMSNIAPGKYKTYITLYVRTKIGNGIDLDWIPGFSFEILNDMNNLEWTYNWGRFILPTPKCILKQ